MSDIDKDDTGKESPPEDDPGDMLELGIMMDEKPAAANTGEMDGNTDDGDAGAHEKPLEETPADALPAGDPSKHAEVQEMVEPRQPGIPDILNEIRDISRRMEELTAHFEGKIKYDEHKNRIIDDLHDQLQDFRDGIIKKHLLSMITDIIKIIDDTRKFKYHYENEAQSENTAVVLLDFMDQIISDLEDLFTFQGVYPFTCASNTFDSARQRIVKKIPTDHSENNRLVAESLRPGYEWEGKVIRPEMVSVYVYNDSLNDKAGES
ncbi:MAG: nucleotide exchange factor GrpE [Desulfosalsimonadaceae bacterium]